VFTGLVEAVGHIQARSQQPLGQRLLVKSELAVGAIGDSVSVNGVCLTVTEVLPDGFFADVSGETLERSTLGRLAVGSAVNLERALRVGGRMGGHFMTGHVDAVIRWISSKKTGPSNNVTLELPAALAPFLAPKGSVGIEGISLTVNEVLEDRFTVMLIPHTRQVTTLDRTRPGDGVNLEVDILARYVVRALTHPPTSENGQKVDLGADIALKTALIRAGFVHDSK
jgi:riboflavin synthase